MQIDDHVAERIREEAERLGLCLVSLRQRYEDIDDLVTTVHLEPAAAETVEKLEDAVAELEGQVIICAPVL